MILCLDVGNSQIFGGVLIQGKIQLRFRYDSKQSATSDQLGVFFKSVLRENNLSSEKIEQIAICSVVPSLDYSLQSACKKYFGIDPFFLKAGVKTGLNINYRNPLEVGADRIANAVAGTHRYPQKNLIIVDFGTATTYCAIRADRTYLGGIIMPGMRLAMDALQNNTAKLSAVNIIKPESIIGRSTANSIQSGIYYSQLATVKYLMTNIIAQTFNHEDAIVIGTGGFASLFADEQIFTVIEPDLVLYGLSVTLNMNNIATELTNE